MSAEKPLSPRLGALAIWQAAEVVIWSEQVNGRRSIPSSQPVLLIRQERDVIDVGERTTALIRRTVFQVYLLSESGVSQSLHALGI